jgi:hypothetical protein
MLEVELDIFSGMPNPTWVLSKKQEGALYELLSAEPKQISSATKLNKRLGLGYRGLIVRRIKTDDSAWDKAMSARRTPFPNEFRLGIQTAKKDSAADWLVKTAGRQGARLADEVREVVSRGVILTPRLRGPVEPTDAIDRKRIKEAEVTADVPYSLKSKHHETWWNCGSNYFSANAHFFNDPAHVTRNNCYCFASNHMPDIRYALPGLRGGRPATSITCGGVIDGLRADGWKDNCQPTGLTIALVIWPNRDYHFYRLVTGGPYWWWGLNPAVRPPNTRTIAGTPFTSTKGKATRRITSVAEVTQTFVAIFIRTTGRRSWLSASPFPVTGKGLIWLAAFVFLASACIAVRRPEYSPAPTRKASAEVTADGGRSMPTRCEIELDIFSGMPNPTWVLTDAETNRWMEQLAALPPMPAREWSGNLGYRGFIVQVTQGGETQVVRVQNGAVHLSQGATNRYASDAKRELEHWLLNTGKPHLKDELFLMVNREIQ